MLKRIWVAASLVSSLCAAAWAGDVPTRGMLIDAVQAHLSQHGDLCVGKPAWPRLVTEDDRRAGSSDAVQLPVLERLGLVKSTLAAALAGSAASSAEAGSARIYELTDQGRAFYLHKKMVTLGPHDQPEVRDGDFCVASLSLDKVVKWSPPQPIHEHLESVVSYTYRIKPAAWLVDPEARKVFPIVDRIIRGEGNALMAVTVQEQNGKWVPVLPGQ